MRVGRRLLVALAIAAAPTLLLAPAFSPARALLPADLLVQFEPWRSQLDHLPKAHWDALVWDGIAQFYPWRAFAAEWLRRGVIPLWNPYQFCGTPFLANAQSAVLYPLNLLFLLLPAAYAFGWSAWLHLCLTGWFMYRLMRRWGAGRAGALCACVVWQANGFTVAWLHLPTVLDTISWLPAVLLMLERALLSGRAGDAAAAGAGLGLSFLAGHPQMFVYVSLMTAAHLVARGLSRATDISLARRAIRLAWVGATAGGLGLALAAAQLLPTLDFLHVAHRAVTKGPAAYQAFLGRALRPAQLLGVLLPHPFGHPGRGTYTGPENYADYACYIGIPALLLGLWAAAARREWAARFLAAAAAGALLVALGTAANLPLYYWAPGMASAGGPSRIVVLFAFCAAALAGLGADRLVRIRPAAALRCALVAVLAGDLLLAARGHVHIVPRAWVYPPVREVARGEGRLLASARDWSLTEFPAAVFPPNAATVYEVRDAAGYDSLYLAHYRDFAALLQNGDPSPPANGNLILFRLRMDSRVDMARLAGVSDYLFAGSGALQTAHDDKAFPRAWVTNSAVSFPTHREAFDALSRLGASRDIVIITGKETPAEPGPEERRVTVADLSPDEVAVSLSAGGGYLFLADAYAPGWQASGRGKAGAPPVRLRVMPADVAFRAVAIPKGVTKVVFRYQPAAFRVGLFVSLLGLAALVAIGIGSWTSRARRN